MMDTSTIGSFFAQMMEQLGEEFDDDAFIRSFAVVLEVDDGDDSLIHVCGSDDRSWAQEALLREGRRALKHSHRAEAEE